MQGEVVESCRIRKSMWDGPFAMSSQYTPISGAYQVPGGPGQSPPYCIILIPGANASAYNVTMYMPIPPTVMWCHEIVNVGSGAGGLQVKGASAGNPNIGLIAAGKRGELIWNIYGSPQEWQCLLSA